MAITTTGVRPTSRKISDKIHSRFGSMVHECRKCKFCGRIVVRKAQRKLIMNGHQSPLNGNVIENNFHRRLRSHTLKIKQMDFPSVAATKWLLWSRHTLLFIENETRKSKTHSHTHTHGSNSIQFNCLHANVR